jgi:hypothetical protein
VFILCNNNNNNNNNNKEHWYEHASSSVENVYESKVTILWNQYTKSDRNRSNKPDVLINIAISGDTKTSKTEVFRNSCETRS